MNDTLLVNFSKIDPVIFHETCLRTKNTLPTNWATVGWQLGKNCMDEIRQGQRGKVPSRT